MRRFTIAGQKLPGCGERSADVWHADSLNVARGDMSLAELSAPIGVFEKVRSVRTTATLARQRYMDTGEDCAATYLARAVCQARAAENRTLGVGAQLAVLLKKGDDDSHKGKRPLTRPLPLLRLGA